MITKRYLSLAILCLLPTSLLALTVEQNPGNLHDSIKEPLTANSNASPYSFTLFNNAKASPTNSQLHVTTTTYEDESLRHEIGVTQSDVPIRTSAVFGNVDGEKGTTKFMLEYGSSAVVITKSGSGLFTVCPENNDDSTTALIQPDSKSYSTYCN